MKNETMKKILTKEKTTIRVDGHTYEVLIDTDDRSVVLSPIGRGAAASSRVSYSEYGYTHGGSVYCHAVDIAKEIADNLPTDTDV